MNKKACHGVVIISIVTIFVFCFHAGAFAEKKDSQCCSYNEGLDRLSTYNQDLDRLSTYYQMVQ